MPNLKANFDAKIDRSGGPDACWPWRAHRGKKGYGRFNAGRGKTNLAHRVAFFLAHGRWPEPCCLHRCDNPPCCNPAHLFEGTHADNVADRERKERRVSVRGERHGCAKLTEQQVLAIRATYATGTATQSRLGMRFGVSDVAIANIVHGKTWKHLISGGPPCQI